MKFILLTMMCAFGPCYAGELLPLANMPLAEKADVLQAAKDSGLHIVWKDEPDAYIKGDERQKWGSVWSDESRLMPFWEAYRKIGRDRKPKP